MTMTISAPPDAYTDDTRAPATLIAVWPLTRLPSVVSRGRDLLRGALTVLRADEETIDNAAIMVSELITNALRHAYPPYELRLYAGGGTAVCEVMDGLAAPLEMPHRPVTPMTMTDLDAFDDPAALETGRGLNVVDQLSDGRCGVRRTTSITEPRTPGKATWFALPLPSGRGGADGVHQ